MTQKAILIFHRGEDRQENANLRHMSMAATSRGYVVVVLTEMDVRIPKGIADHTFHVPSFDNTAALFPLMQEIMQTHSIERIYAPNEAHTMPAAYLRAEHNIPGLLPEQAICFRDRDRLQERAKQLAIDGLYVPASCSPDSIETLKKILNRYGKIVIKSRRRDASRQTFHIQSMHKLQAVWHKIKDNRHQYRVEEYIHGTKFGVDVVVQSDKVVFDFLFEFTFEIVNYHSEIVGMMSRRNDRSARHEAVLRINADLVKGLGLANGTAHIEYFVTAGGRVYLIKAAARLGTGPTVPAIEAASGLQLATEWSLCDLDPTHQPVPTRTHEVMAERVPVEGHGTRGTWREDITAFPHEGHEMSYSLLMGERPRERTIKRKRYRLATITH